MGYKQRTGPYPYQKEKNHLIIHYKRWYRFYYNDDDRKAGLLSEYEEDTIKEGLLVQCTPNGEHLFAYFPNILSFLQYESNFKPEDRGFFETVLADVKQKPRFDLDVKLSEHRELFDSIPDKTVDQIMDDLIAYLIWGILQVMAEVDIQLDLSKDVLIFTSHGEDKRSFHVVIDNYCHEDCGEAKRFYKRVMKKLAEINMPHFFAQWIDHAVYSKLQQFRMEGSQKYKSGRIKRLKSEWIYGSTDPITVVTDLSAHRASIEELSADDKEILYFPQAQDRFTTFRASLLTNTGYCIVLPSFQTDDDIDKPIGCLAIHDDMAHQAVEMLAEWMGTQVGSPNFPFAFNKLLSNGIIVLKRLFSSHCSVCGRPHDGDNPFMYIIHNRVFFNCRRHIDNKSIKVGNMVDVEEEIRTGPTDEELRSMVFTIPTVDRHGRVIESGETVGTVDKNQSVKDAPAKSGDIFELSQIASGVVQLGRVKKGSNDKHRHIRREGGTVDLSAFDGSCSIHMI